MVDGLQTASSTQSESAKLAGHNAVITGAGSGIGRAIAETFARAGASVAMLDLNADSASETADYVRTFGARSIPLVVDVADSGDVSRAFQACRSALGEIDILVNNAGVGQLGTVTDLDESTWDRTIAVNLKSIFLCSRQVIPQMAEIGGGKIINIASVTGLVASPGRAVYCASKGGVVMLTRAMALDHAPQRINVNAICPGVIVTAMTEASLADKSVLQEKLDKTPLGRLGSPSDIAAAALYLASPASDFVTGSCLVVDGGWSVD